MEVEGTSGSCLVSLYLGSALKFCWFAQGLVWLELGYPQGQSIPLLVFDLLCQEIIFRGVLVEFPLLHLVHASG